MIYDTKGVLKKIFVGELLIHTFYGIIDLVYHYQYGKKNIELLEVGTVGYEIPEIINVSDDGRYINHNHFKRIENTEYFVNISGIIYDGRLNKIKSYYYDDTMYPTCYVGKSLTIHTIVYLAWNGQIPIGYTIDHIDGKKYNNHHTNLEAVERHENIKRSFITNLRNSEWADNIDIICRMMENECSIENIAESIGYESSESLDASELQLLLVGIENGTHWPSISRKYNISPGVYKIVGYKPRNRLSKKDIDTVYKKYSEGYSQKEIADMLNINRKRLNYILYNEKAYPEIRGRYTYENKYERPLLSDIQAHEIFVMIMDGKSIGDIVSHYNNPLIDSGLITRMRCGTAYKEIGLSYNLKDRPSRNKLQAETVCEICKKLELGLMSMSAIAREYKVGFHAISGIWHGETWRDISQDYKMKYNS